MGIIGTIFPKILAASTVGIGSPIQIPTGMAPRNSTTGMADMIARIAISGIPKVRKKLAIFWPVCKVTAATGAS